jgi:hypothetical protein
LPVRDAGPDIIERGTITTFNSHDDEWAAFMANTRAPTAPVRRPRRRALIIVATLAVVVATIWIATQHGASASARPTAGFRCGPYLNYPDLKPGHAGATSTTFSGYRATYATSLPVTTTDPTLSGMPFPGVLTLTHGTQHWTLARPAGQRIGQLGGICVIRFKSESHPAVMVEGFSGGAHCCMVPVLYSFDATTSTYAKVLDMSAAKFTGAMKFDPNDGYVAKTVGGQVVLETGDGVFPYYFGCYACTPAPIHLEVLRGPRLVDVTGEHPQFVEANAHQLWISVVSEENGADGYYGLFGSLAAWTAEQCTIGRGASAWSQVRVLESKGVLSDQHYYQGTFMTRGSFVPTLKAFLMKNGYCRGQIPS